MSALLKQNFFVPTTSAAARYFKKVIIDSHNEFNKAVPEMSWKKYAEGTDDEERLFQSFAGGTEPYETKGVIQRGRVINVQRCSLSPKVVNRIRQRLLNNGYEHKIGFPSSLYMAMDHGAGVDLKECQLSLVQSMIKPVKVIVEAEPITEKVRVWDIIESGTVVQPKHLYIDNCTKNDKFFYQGKTPFGRADGRTKVHLSADKELLGVCKYTGESNRQQRVYRVKSVI